MLEFKCIKNNMLGLSKEEIAIFKKLDTPRKIQDFFDTFARNLEKKGDTLMSPRRVLRERKMHCIEGAFLAAAILWFHGEKPLVINLRATKNDFDHTITLYRRFGYWGAISKTNHFGLRWRDPVYKNIRELVMSYFHEYLHDDNDNKTLRAYSKEVDMRRFGKKWITDEEDLFEIAGAIQEVKHFPVAPPRNMRLVRPTDKMECQVNRLVEWDKSDPRT